MKETAFVCLEEGNSNCKAATMESVQMKKHRDSIFIRSFPQRFGSTMAAPATCILIEGT
jgi:hypothetical protein